MAVLDRFFFFFHLGHKKVVAGRVRQVIILYNNSGIGIGCISISVFGYENKDKFPIYVTKNAFKRHAFKIYY